MYLQEKVKGKDLTPKASSPFNGYRVENGTPNKEIFFDDGEAVATVEGTGSSAIVRYTHTDHLTGSALVTDAVGTQVQLLDYHPFGTQRINEQTTDYNIKRKFAGHEYDEDLALSYMLARYYNPSTGKFLSEDPAFVALGETGSFEQRFSRSLEQFLSDPQLLNSYSYARNNPLTLLDPTGAAPAVPATQYLPPFHQVLMTSQFNVGMAMMKYGLMYSTAMDIETVTDNEQSTANRVIAGVSLGTMFLGGEVSGGTKLIQGGRAVVGAADDAARAGKIVGQTFGSLGQVIKNPGLVIRGYTEHGLAQKITRAVPSQLVKETVDHASVVLRQKGNTFLHLTERAGVVLNNAGNVVTTYGSNLFKKGVRDVLNTLK